MLTLRRRKFFIKLNMTLKVTKGLLKINYDLKGHKRPPSCQNHSSTYVFGPILIKICMNANIMKTQFFH